MSRRRDLPLSRREVPMTLRSRLRSPLVVVLGSPAEVVHLLSAVDVAETVCYQMDLYQAERLREALEEAKIAARVETLPDLWDLPADFQSAVYMPAQGGERELKIDMAEQAFHVLRPHGTFVVWSGYETDPFLAALLKKVFGRSPSQGEGREAVFWTQRDGERPRRRHEMTFQAKVRDRPSCRFLSRPGTFSYGRFDNGARALAEVAEVGEGARVLDLGCGCGTNGVFAAQAAGTDAFVAFVDSNVRAIALAESNAAANGVPKFRTFATATVEGPQTNSFDVVLANPPYYAAGTIARLFVERARDLLKTDGRLFLVTKQPNEVGAVIMELFGAAEAVMHRGYTVLIA
jgi:16S rRNA (guanine1207-N2)-methyltransferase